MAATTEILTVAEVEANALKTATFDDALLEDFILAAQRQYLRPFLGKTFYNQILTQVAASTLTSDNSTLLNDYLKPMMSYYVVYDSFPSIAMNITSKGIMVNQSETALSASGSDRAMMRQNYLSMAERWKKDADQFIKDEVEDDSTKFTDYCPADDFNNKGMFVV